MSKNIVLLSDGTGNSAAKVFRTNVWRLSQILDLRDPTSQIAYYDDGVGTSSFKLFAILGGVFGFGLKRNVIDIYSFCCRNYQPGDRIYCFGFSRGAFTIRIVAGMIARQGLVAYDDDEANLARFAADAYRLYRRRFTGGILKYLSYVGVDLRGVRDFAIRQWRKLMGQRVSAPAPTAIESIHFVGLWDTVDAYGGPIEEMTRAIDYWVWPLSMPDRFMSAKVLKACHALALEDERQAFSPVIWDQRYVRGSAEVPGARKQTGCSRSTMIREAMPRSRQSPRRICGRIFLQLIASASARSGSRAFIRTSAADIRRTVFPM
jgi:T6SS, Phospholipase effector Tle1-like, catalytic domain